MDDALMRIIRLLQAKRRQLFVGPPGIAKTAMLIEATERLGWKFVRSTPGIEERTDYGGCFVPDVDKGVTKILPLEKLKQLIETKEPTVWDWDDIGNATMDVQAALKALATTGGPFHKHPYVVICGTTNRPGDKTGVSGMHESLRSEFHMSWAMPTPDLLKEGETAEDEKVRERVSKMGTMLCTWGELVDQWVNWAVDYNAPAEVIAFHRASRGRDLYKWKPHADPAIRMADFRAWHSVIDTLNAGIRDQKSLEATIGKDVATTFLGFRDLAGDLPAIDQIMMDPKGAKLPKPENAAGNFFISSAISQAADAKWIEAALLYIERLPRIYTALAARDIYRRQGSVLTGNKIWAKWFQKNHDLFDIE